MFEHITVDLNQGTRDGEKVGYVTDGVGGYFFESKRTLKDTLNSLEADEVDRPLFSLDEARRALKAVLRRRAKYVR